MSTHANTQNVINNIIFYKKKLEKKEESLTEKK